MERSPRSIASGLAASLLLSVPLVVVPVIGPLLATWIGARRTGRNAVFIGVVVAVLWGALLYGVSGQELTFGNTKVGLGPLMLLIPSVCGSLLAGGLFAAGGRTPVNVGLVILVGGTIWTASDLKPLVGLIQQLRPERTEVAVTGPSCEENLKKLYTAAMLYSDSWDGMLPPADRWEEALKETLADHSALQCPEAPAGSGGYAMNAALGGKRVSDLEKPETEPLFFDTQLPGPSAHGSLEDAPKPGRHAGKNSVVYADGHTASVTAD